jgi:hypothetical protein
VLLAILLSDTLGFTWWTLTVIIAMTLVIGYVLRLGVNILEVPISAMLILATSSTVGHEVDDWLRQAYAPANEIGKSLRESMDTLEHEEGDHERLESELDRHLRAAEERQNELSEMLNSDPRANPAGWPLRGEMIAHLDRLRTDLASGKPTHAYHPRGRSILRPESLFRRRRPKFRRRPRSR